MNLGSGFDANTLTLSNSSDNTNKTFLLSPSTNRLTGSRGDQGTEMSEFLVKANAAGSNLTFTSSLGGSTEILNYYQPQNVDILKKDNHDNNVTGAHLKLYKVNSDGTESLIDEWDTDGTTKSLFLLSGEYILKETTIPTGYTKADDLVFFVDIKNKLVINNEAVQNITMVDNKETYNYTVYYKDKASNQTIWTTKTGTAEHGTVVTASSERAAMEVSIEQGEGYEYVEASADSITVDSAGKSLTLYYLLEEIKIVTIKNELYGNMAKKDKEFTYTVQTLPISGNITLPDGTQKTLQQGDTFTLKDDEVATIYASDLNSNHIKIVQTEETDYTTSTKLDSGSDTSTIEIDVNLSADHAVIFKNYYNTSADTGVRITTLPYIIIIGIAIFGLGLFAVFPQMRKIIIKD